MPTGYNGAIHLARQLDPRLGRPFKNIRLVFATDGKDVAIEHWRNVIRHRTVVTCTKFIKRRFWRVHGDFSMKETALERRNGRYNPSEFASS